MLFAYFSAVSNKPEIVGMPWGDVSTSLIYSALINSAASLAPKEHETKLNGEVKGLDKVFVVDASGLPSIPTKPYTFTIMANADRIARGILSSSF